MTTAEYNAKRAKHDAAYAKLDAEWDAKRDAECAEQ